MSGNPDHAHAICDMNRSEIVFSGTDFGENRDIVCLIHAQRRLHLRQTGAQERICRQFLGQTRGDREATFAARCGDPLDARDKLLVPRFKGRGKTEVRGGVFVARADQRLGRQRGKLAQAVPHLCGRAFKKPPAASGHQAVGGEGETGLGEVIGDVADGMAGHVDDNRTERALAAGIAATEGPIEGRKPVGLGAGPTTFAA